MGHGGGGNITKEEIALKFIEGIKSGKKFTAKTVAKEADLGGACHATKIIGWSNLKNVKKIGKGEYLKL